MGVAEQNMMGVAAGLAACGLIAFPTCFAVFASKRVHDQVSISIAYTNLNVKIVGSYAGLTTPNTGATHQATDDIAVMRSMPNMKVVVPADAVEVEQAVFALAEEEGPFYLRIAKCAAPVIFDDDYKFELGRAVTLRTGCDVALIGTGIMTAMCLDAADELSKQGIEAAVLHVPTLKPIDAAGIVEVADSAGAVVTVENHSIIGGLGSAVGEVLGESRPCPMQRVGIRDIFGESAESMKVLFDKFGLSVEAIVRAARQVTDRKATAHSL
jgi:transketolase